jgi:cephalosporin hydroxylase
MVTMMRADAVNSFHRLYYENSNRTWRNTTWLGVPTEKCPLDLWIYQEILHEVRPDLIVECGTNEGGSALFFASICDLLTVGRVLTVDLVEYPGRPLHPRITYLHGSSTDEEVVESVRAAASAADKVMVVLDSDHTADHVYEELSRYAGLVTCGSYLVVEDTNINGWPVLSDFGPGPMEAVDRFLRQDDRFVIDGTREKFFMTFNPRGYLRRII